MAFVTWEALDLMFFLYSCLQSAFVQQSSFQFILRILNTNVDGKKSMLRHTHTCFISFP